MSAVLLAVVVLSMGVLVAAVAYAGGALFGGWTRPTTIAAIPQLPPPRPEPVAAVAPPPPDVTAHVDDPGFVDSVLDGPDFTARVDFTPLTPPARPAIPAPLPAPAPAAQRLARGTNPPPLPPPPRSRARRPEFTDEVTRPDSPPPYSS